jgi:ankyrin repeat protein
MVAWLLELNANTNCADANGWTPLHLAVSRGQTSFAKQLHAKGAQLDAQTTSGNTSLYHAVNNEQFEIATWLLELNANANCPDENGWTPLHLAASQGYLDIAKQLYAKGAQLNVQTKSGMSPLHRAVAKGQSGMVAWLLDMGADLKAVTENGWTPLHIAASDGHIDIAKQLYEKGAPVDARAKNDITPLYLASRVGHFDLVVWLIQQNANVNLVSSDGDGPLQAATNGHLEVAKYLHANGGQIDSRTKDGHTLLHIASAGGYLPLVAWLIELNLDVNCPTTGGKWMPMHYAAEGGHVATINQLLKFGANAKAESSDGWTPLHMAASLGHLAPVNRLLELGADPNHHSKFDVTPFHCAVYHGGVPILEAFARHSGDPLLQDGYGRNVLDWASAYPPAFRALERFYGRYVPSTESATKDYLAARIRTLLQSTHDTNDWLDFLARLLIRVGNDVDATTALEQHISSDRGDSVISHPIRCEMCEALSIQGSRYVCRDCADTDICESCMIRYKEGEGIRACSKHAFLKIPSEAWKTLLPSQVNEMGESLEEWLKRLKGQWVGDQPDG